MKDSLKHIDPHSLHDAETLRSVLLLVLQAMESMSKELSEMKAENGRLKAEINRLKGEKGRPEFKRKEKTSPDDKYGQSGEKAGKRTNHKTGTTKDRLGIDQTIELKELGQELPPDCAHQVLGGTGGARCGIEAQYGKVPNSGVVFPLGGPNVPFVGFAV